MSISTDKKCGIVRGLLEKLLYYDKLLRADINYAVKELGDLNMFLNMELQGVFQEYIANNLIKLSPSKTDDSRNSFDFLRLYFLFTSYLN